MDYPYNSARILTDDIYLSYGGHTGTSTTNQRGAAYLIAEKKMTSHIGTFLPLTTITGTYPWPLGGTFFVTEHNHIRSIDAVKILTIDDWCDCGLDSDTGCGFIYDDTYGYILVSDVNACLCSCSCSSHTGPFQFQVTYTAGLGSGTCYQADMLAALTITAEIALMEMIDPGYNEGVGDVGIQQFANQSYSEVRVKLRKTALGSSARANYAAGLVNNYRHYRALKMGY